MILVTGATGHVGRALVRELAARSVPFRALVRDAARGEALGCDYVVGDLDSPDTLEPAFAGVRRLFLNTPAGPALVARQTAAIAAARRAGVERIVKISVPGVGPQTRSGMGGGHGRVEAELQACGIAWSVLRPMVFMQNLLGHADSIRGQGRFFGAYGEGRIAFIDTDDVGAAGAALLTGPPAPGESFVITGAAALTHGEVAGHLSRALGRPIQYVDLPVEKIVAHMVAEGMPAEEAQNLGAMMTAMSRGGASFTTQTLPALIGRAPRSLDQFLAANRAAFL